MTNDIDVSEEVIALLTYLQGRNLSEEEAYYVMEAAMACLLVEEK